jgi:hypothetical protein
MPDTSILAVEEGMAAMMQCLPHFYDQLKKIKMSDNNVIPVDTQSLLLRNTQE